MGCPAGAQNDEELEHWPKKVIGKANKKLLPFAKKILVSYEDLEGIPEKYKKKVIEIGNIVNTMDKFVDVGFGMERLQAILDGDVVHSATETLQETIEKIIYSGYKPGPQKQGYVLRKLLRELYIRGGHLDHPFFEKEVERQEKARVRYLKLSEKPSNRTKSKEWWFDTHGIDLDEMKRLNQNKDE